MPISARFLAEQSTFQPLSCSSTQKLARKPSAARKSDVKGCQSRIVDSGRVMWYFGKLGRRDAGKNWRLVDERDARRNFGR